MVYSDTPRYERKRIFGTEAELGTLGGTEKLHVQREFLRNGGLIYLDLNHLEYASPETRDPVSAIAYARAGEIIVSHKYPQARFFRNNVAYSLPDPKALKNDLELITFGAHESYFTYAHCYDRKLLPFLVTRQIFAGAGRLRHDGAFEITQRSAFIESEISARSTVDRGIINVREEPLASVNGWQRLHLILGDANMCEVAEFLKLGATGLVLDLAEDDSLPSLEYPLPKKGESFLSVRDIKKISQQHKDWKVSGLEKKIKKATDVQRAYLNAAKRYYDRDEVTTDLLDRWEYVLNCLDEDPRQLFGEVDWVTKLYVLNAVAERHDLPMTDSLVAEYDLNYHNINPSESVFYKLQQAGKIKRIVTDEFIARAAQEPPPNTRAYVRGKIAQAKPELTERGIYWDEISGIPMVDPFTHDQTYFQDTFFHDFLSLGVPLSLHDFAAQQGYRLLQRIELGYKNELTNFIAGFNALSGLDYIVSSVSTKTLIQRGFDSFFRDSLINEKGAIGPLHWRTSHGFVLRPFGKDGKYLNGLSVEQIPPGSPVRVKGKGENHYRVVITVGKDELKDLDFNPYELIFLHPVTAFLTGFHTAADKKLYLKQFLDESYLKPTVNKLHEVEQECCSLETRLKRMKPGDPINPVLHIGREILWRLFGDIFT